VKQKLKAETLTVFVSASQFKNFLLRLYFNTIFSVVEWEQRHSSGVNNSQDSAFIEEREGYQDLKQNNNNSRKTTRQQELKEQECLIGGGGGGEYGSDCSAETLSVNSAQSMQNR